MSKKLVTSDTHFNHANIIRYCNRPWLQPGDLDATGNWVSKSIAKIRADEMNEHMITQWNAVVGPNDDIWHLGDFGFGDYTDILRRLHGRIHMIVGSHDKQIWEHKDRFVEISPMLDVEGITLCHYALRTWPKSHFNSCHLYGHSHGTLPGIGKSFDIGVDCWSFTPVSLDTIKEEMEKMPDNPNFIKEKDRR